MNWPKHEFGFVICLFSVIAAIDMAFIRARIEFCEAERRRLLKMMTSYQVDLAWISERMDCIQKDLRPLDRDLKSQEKLVSNEWG